MNRRSIALILACVVAGLAFPGMSEAGDSSFLWRATRDQRTLYLLGSIHYMKRDAYPLSPAIEGAYDRSGMLVFETDIEGLDRAAVALLSAGTLEGEATLRETIPPELFEAVSQRLETLGMGVAGVARMKPWMVALSLTSMELMRSGYLGSEGIDAHFSSRAEADGKAKKGLETIEYQVSLFADLTTEEGVDFLRYTMTELDTVIPLVDELVVSWKKGDSNRMEQLLTDGFEEHRALFDRMVTERNQRWLPVLEEIAGREIDALVVVGALHLVGEQGLIALLRARGYEIEQL